jgi:ATP-dependent DNA helicase RecQ
MNNMQTMTRNEQLKETLHKVFGFQQFRANQEGIIQNILAQKDVLAVMPTGAGKSLCYQLPAKILKGTAIVISPLISLMKDQVDAAQSNGISAAFLNSSLSGAAVSEVYQKINSGSLELLYIAPERFAMESFIETLQKIPIVFFAIDEAHCVSEWGHDFRPDYLSLAKIVEKFPGVVIAAFTATATHEVQKDIIQKLKLRSPYTVRASFDRPNLFYQVENKFNADSQILQFLKNHAGEQGIIYRTTRDAVERTAEFLNQNGIQALPYHAGLAPEKRAQHQEAFNRDVVPVMVATIAFGMGIDKSNIRFVIHGDLPKNLEGYYQETGRAGRDGEPSHCVLFYDGQDIAKQKYFIEKIEVEKEKELAYQKLNQMARFASHHVCRRKALLGYFGEEYPGDNCKSCDVCQGEFEKVDITDRAKKILAVMLATQQRFGIGHTLDILVGANTQKIREHRQHLLPEYALGKGLDKKAWREVVDELLAQEIVVQEGEPYAVLKLTAKAAAVMKNEISVIALKRESVKQQAAVETLEFDQTLFERLRILRRRLADEQGVPPFIIFSDRSLREMSFYYPATSFDFSKIGGVGENKLNQYGAAFVAEIKKYLIDHPEIKIPVRGLKSKKPVPAKVASETFEKTYELYQQGLSLEAIAQTRALASSTIRSHIEKLILAGKNIDMQRFVTPEKQTLIQKTFLELKTSSLTPVVEKLQGAASYDEAALVRAVMQVNSKGDSGSLF